MEPIYDASGRQVGHVHTDGTVTDDLHTTVGRSDPVTGQVSTIEPHFTGVSPGGQLHRQPPAAPVSRAPASDGGGINPISLLVWWCLACMHWVVDVSLRDTIADLAARHLPSWLGWYVLYPLFGLGTWSVTGACFGWVETAFDGGTRMDSLVIATYVLLVMVPAPVVLAPLVKLARLAHRWAGIAVFAGFVVAGVLGLLPMLT